MMLTNHVINFDHSVSPIDQYYGQKMTYDALF
jgi:hypothetical protein